MEPETTFYTYDIQKDMILPEIVDMRKLFIEELQTQKNLSKSTVNQSADNLLQKKQQYSKEMAEQTAAYYRKEKKNCELRERRRIEKERKGMAYSLWLSSQPLENISRDFRIDLPTIKNYVEDEKRNRLEKGMATFSDAGKKDGFKIPLYNVWKQQKKSGTPIHFGNSEIRWVENLLYLYTDPFDTVVDLFAGSGSTIDVCRWRERRYWVSDRLPIPEREHEIHKWDITYGLPDIDWSEVKLVYLDPPYWKQAEGKYSRDATDLANMDLAGFNKTLSSLILNEPFAL